VHRWNALASGSPPALVLWYRSSPQPLAPVRATSDVTMVSPGDPPPTDTGMRTIILDTRGRLQEFHAVPPQRDLDTSPAPAPPWSALFTAAGLSMSSFTPAAPQWTPRDFADTRAAWVGTLADRPDVPIRVEAAAYRGRPVSFLIVGPWSRASRMEPIARSALSAVVSSFGLMFWITAVIVSAFLARYNLRLNRADRRSASRLAIIFIALQIAGWIVGNHHVPDVSLEVASLFKALSNAGFAGGFLWVLYLALEPYGRRVWPDGLLGWTRLLAGHIADPRVGRDVLVGCAFGAGLLLLELAHQFAPLAIGAPPPVPQLGTSLRGLVSPAWLALDWTQRTFSTVQSALLIVLTFVALRLLVRRTWAATAIGVVVVGAASLNGALATGGIVWIDALATMVAVALVAVVIFRFGLLATTVMLLVDNLPSAVPFTGRVFHWSAAPGLETVALVLAVGAFGFRAARAGQPLFGGAPEAMTRSLG